MKATVLTIALAATALLIGGCSATRNNDNDFAIPSRAEYSWRAFCDARSYDVSTAQPEIINEYLDTWRGSVEEEQALNL